MTLLRSSSPFNDTIRRVFVLACISFFATSVHAGYSCDINGGFPQVFGLSVVDGQLRAIVGPIDSSSYGSISAVQLGLTRDGTWERLNDGSFPMRHDGTYAEQCLEAPVDEGWIKDFERESDSRYYNQHIGACARDDKYEWGGISFNGGEGSWGMGGLVSKDLETGAIRYHWIPQLERYSASHIAAFGGHIWIGTAHYDDCSDKAVAGGIMRYGPQSRHNIAFKVPEVCGFAVNDFVVHDEVLWVATELGIAKLDDQTELRRAELDDATVQLNWQNFIPDLLAPELMRAVDCDDLYEELLNSDRMAYGHPTEVGYPFEAFWRQLSRLRPEFTSRYLRKLHGHKPKGHVSQ